MPASPTTSDQPRTRRPGHAGLELVLAWVSAALLPWALMALFVTSDRTSGAEGAADALPQWTLVAAIISVFALAISALWAGTRALRHGRQSGMVPAAAGAGVIGYFALMLTLSVIAHVVLGIE